MAKAKKLFLLIFFSVIQANCKSRDQAQLASSDSPAAVMKLFHHGDQPEWVIISPTIANFDVAYAQLKSLKEINSERQIAGKSIIRALLLFGTGVLAEFTQDHDLALFADFVQVTEVSRREVSKPQILIDYPELGGLNDIELLQRFNFDRQLADRTKAEWLAAKRDYELQLEDTHGLVDPWMRDFGVFVSLADRRVLINLNKKFQRGQDVVLTVARALNLETITIFSTSATNGDLGGNIMFLPHDILIEGGGSQNLTQQFKNGGFRGEGVKLTANFTPATHVDEIISYAMTESGELVLLYPSPHRGLQLLLETPIESLSPETLEMEIDKTDKLDFKVGTYYQKVKRTAQIHEEELDSHFRTPMANPNLATQYKAQLFFNMLVEKELEKVRAVLNRRQIGFSEIALPTIVWTDRATITPFITGQDFIRFLGGNPTNLVQLDTHIWMPDSGVDVFREAISADLQRINIKPTFIDVSFLNHLRGNIHCATNVLRKK